MEQKTACASTQASLIFVNFRQIVAVFGDIVVSVYMALIIIIIVTFI